MKLHTKSAALPSPRPHGGPDALGVPLHDFSTNSNACGPCPHVVLALQACDASRYPDPGYTDLRVQLAEFHGVRPEHVVVAASASEFIYRMTAWVAQRALGVDATLPAVQVPLHGYGDYTQAARAWGLPVVTSGTAALRWHANPSSPLGERTATDTDHAAVRVLDCAYQPLQLDPREPGGHVAQPADDFAQNNWWQLWTPNKALGLTGVRGAYAIAPVGSEATVIGLNALCPSWPVGVHGVALLQAWVQSDVQHWLAHSRHTLAQWKQRQVHALQEQGWQCLPSSTNYFVAKPPMAGIMDCDDSDAASALAKVLEVLRTQGIKLRDAASFGLPGRVRMSVQAPQSQDALVHAWERYASLRTGSLV